MNRRKFIAVIGSVTTTGLAGCSGGGGSDTGSPERVAKAYFEATESSDVEGLIHPDSPLEPSSVTEDMKNKEITAETEIAAENIDSESLSEFGDDLEDRPNYVEGAGNKSRRLGPSNLSDSELDAVAGDEDVTLVEADIDVEVSGEEGDTLEGFLEEGPVHILTATDGDEWLILDETMIIVSVGP
jgi:hypothetical protein